MEYKQFIFKLEWEPSLSKLTTLQKGILLEVFYDYHNGRDLDFNGDTMIEMLWLNLLPHIERMNHKYKTSVENGKKGGVPKGTTPWNKGKKQTDSEPNTNPTQSETNQPRTLKVKEKVKVKEEVKDDIIDITSISTNILGEIIESNPHKIHHVSIFDKKENLIKLKEQGFVLQRRGYPMSEKELEEFEGIS